MIPEVLEASIRASAPQDPERGWGWVRGFLAGCGALYLPRNGYYLLFQVRGNTAAANRLAEILTRGGYSFGRRSRGKGIDVTLRKGPEIRRLLERIGLGEIARRIGETASIRSMRDRANRLVNCDSANIDKTVLAAERQMVLARLLEERGDLWDLPDPLRDVVRVRLANPSASLRELGYLLSRPVSKSTVEYRWRKIETLVQTMMKGEGHHVPGKG
jgi:DNA-binding protein WhiA